MRRVFGLLVLLPLLAGCFASGPPRMEAYKDVEDAFRVPLPVPTDASGGWALVDRRLGIIGQGTVAARIDENGKVLWRTTLPARFALTGRRPGQARTAAHSSDSVVTLIGAAAPGRLPSIATLDPLTGRFAELARPPARTPGELRLVTVTWTSGTRMAVAATCLPSSSCTLTAWDADTGKVLWTHRTRGPAVFATPCGQDVAEERGAGRLLRRCDPLVFVADGRLVTLWSGEDRLRSRPVELPGGEIAQVIPTLYRIVVVTAPHGPGCHARAAAYDIGETAAPVWQRAFTWEQPQAAVREGCRRDPSIPLRVGYRLALPDSAGALVGDDYHGTFPLRLNPGEYPVAYGGSVLAYRVDGSHRDPQPVPSTTRRPRPAALDPTAQELGQGAWYVPGKGRSGEIIAVDPYGKITWRRATSGPAFFLAANRLVYVRGSSLVGVRPSE
ncbi:hypothetical protein ABZ434_11835 [Streptomyces sp. NPDC005761]|uniref:hypothetical protein n=1 Tax=unclassified Streptomyces TaxID=2593676 RepID=UPI003402FF0C